jgi:nitrate reductase delta subunit
VTGPASRCQALGDFAELLSYPEADPASTARRCRERVVARARKHLDAFVDRAERAPRHALEEAFSAAFDLEPACAPYVGYHLCGDGPLRGQFLAELAGVYTAAGFTPPGPTAELPDHLAVVLRFLAGTPGGEARDALLEDGLAPALERMLGAFGGSDNPYRFVLAALREELR